MPDAPGRRKPAGPAPSWLNAMAFRHPLIPPQQWAAAGSCGKLIAQGILAAEDVLPELCRAAMRAGYKGDLRGLRTHIAWHLADTADHWRRERDRAEFLIRRGIGPLLELLAEGSEILAKADAINTEAGEPLFWREVRAIVSEEMAATIAKQSRTPARRRHAR